MKVCLIGCGFIGTTLATAMDEMDEIGTVYVTDKSIDKAASILSCRKVSYRDDIEDAIEEVDLVIEAASQQAVQQYAPLALGKEKDILVMSVGAFADDELLRNCTELAKNNRCRVYIPTGAICGIDGLSSASIGKLYEVSLTSTKSVKALTDNPYLKEKGINLEELKEPTVVFEGNARDAVQHFPKTSNVAATLSLAGLGFEATIVKIIADPHAERNIHRVNVRGEFGELKTELQNVPSPANPKTSILAALSAISGLKKVTGVVWVGI